MMRAVFVVAKDTPLGISATVEGCKKLLEAAGPAKGEYWIYQYPTEYAVQGEHSPSKAIRGNELPRVVKDVSALPNVLSELESLRSQCDEISSFYYRVSGDSAYSHKKSMVHREAEHWHLLACELLNGVDRIEKLINDFRGKPVCECRWRAE